MKYTTIQLLPALPGTIAVTFDSTAETCEDLELYTHEVLMFALRRRDDGTEQIVGFPVHSPIGVHQALDDYEGFIGYDSMNNDPAGFQTRWEDVAHDFFHRLPGKNPDEREHQEETVKRPADRDLLIALRTFGKLRDVVIFLSENGFDSAEEMIKFISTFRTDLSTQLNLADLEERVENHCRTIGLPAKSENGN